MNVRSWSFVALALAAWTPLGSARAQEPPLYDGEGDAPTFSTVFLAEEESPSDSPKPKKADAPSEKPAGEKPNESEIDKLRKRLDDLEKSEKKRTEGEKKKADDEKKKKDADKAKEEDWQDMSSEKWTVKLGGHIQLDYVNWMSNDAAVPGRDYVHFRRLRLVADGQGYGVYDFRLQVTLEPETDNQVNPALTQPAVKDAYISQNEIPWLGRFRIGNFFVPYSLEQVTNDTNNIFIERSIPTQGIFAADREVGVALYNCTPDQNLTWTTGAFFDSVSEGSKVRIDDNQGYRLSGRVTGLPYYDEPSNGRYLLHVGGGVLHTKPQNGFAQFRARPQVNQGPRLIDSGLLPAETYTTGNLEAAWVNGPFTLQTEAFASNVNLRNRANENAYGAYIHASWFVTGECRVFERFGQHGAQFARNVPFTNYFLAPGCFGSGALELKARWSYLDLARFDRGQYNDFTFGWNWYWTDRTRIMFDWIHPITSTQAVFGAQSADLMAIRFDTNW